MLIVSLSLSLSLLAGCEIRGPGGLRCPHGADATTPGRKMDEESRGPGRDGTGSHRFLGVRKTTAEKHAKSREAAELVPEFLIM